MTFKDQILRDKKRISGRIIRNIYKNETFLDVKQHFLTGLFLSFLNVPKKSFWGLFFYKKVQ